MIAVGVVPGKYLASTNFDFSCGPNKPLEDSLKICLDHIEKLKVQTKYLIARDLHELMLAHEITDRVDVAEVLIYHLLHRKETRWPGFQKRVDYPVRDDENWLKFVNSKRDLKTGTLEIIERPYSQTVQGDRQ